MLDNALLDEIQSTLLEPRDAGVTIPSGLWTPEELLAYLNQRQNRFLKTTLLQVGLADITVTAGVARYALPDDWLTTVDVFWRSSTGVYTPLLRGDSFEADHGLDDWATTRGTPLLYLDEDSPLLTIRLAPLPIANGRLLLFYVPQAAPLVSAADPANENHVLTVPDEYAHAAGKYGVLAEAFGKDGRGADPSRAAYCEGRYQLGVEMAQILLTGWS